uniref:Fe2OG dioxygenase domain-containing protein n=1 Tax=Lotharella globosa TaxID=91324 RepID=A0A7S4DM86_9EUKA|mmetsp:Transcript_27806/g.54152  ORF Transcript_27806/g.54152 Transcript_27806/m.54152 type:complete len:577 (-) Transcript_27806:439-2169(-)
MEAWDTFLTLPNEPALLEPFGLGGEVGGEDDFGLLESVSVTDVKAHRKARSPIRKKRRVARSKKPKKPRTGYNYFHLHERESMMRGLVAQGFQSDKEALNAEVNRRIALKWKTMGTNEKRVHLMKAEADKVRYEKELAEYTNSSSSSAVREMPSRCLPGTLEGLKALAEKLGIKRARVGWAICCPPSGTKTDIRRAVTNHMKQQPSRQSQLPIMPSLHEVKLAVPVDRAVTGSPTLFGHPLAHPNIPDSKKGTIADCPLVKPLLEPLANDRPAVAAFGRADAAAKADRKGTQNLMSMRALGSRTWLLDLARRHNLLSEKSKPFLKDAMDAIEKELSLTMTRMSKRVLSIVANNTNISPTTNIHKLIKQFNKLQEDFEVSPDLVAMVDAVSVRDISRPQSLVRLTTGTVKGFFILNKPLCDLLISEAKRCAKHCELKFGQISVETLGLQNAMTKLALKAVLPALGLDTTVDYEVDGSVIFDGDKPLSNDFTFTADPADDWDITGSERSLPYHRDDSVITINMCLGDKFTGGSILFENVVEVEHQVCRGIVHPGNMRHKVTPCKGQRFNLILFLNKKD